MVEELNDGSQDNIGEAWLETFIAAMNNCRLYGSTHSRVLEVVKQFAELTSKLHQENKGDISLSFADNTVKVNNAAANPGILSHRRLAGELRQRSVHTLIISEGVHESELSKFMELFSEKPKNLASRGGLGVLLEEAGVRNIQLATLKYAERLENKPEEAVEDRRVLFARMEECLSDFDGAAVSSEELDERYRELVAVLENPEATLEFLDRKKTEQEPDDEFAQKIVQTLERAGTLAYTHHPEKWDSVKQNLAKALLLLPSALRGHVLEILTTEEDGAMSLQEVIAELEPEQIALILVDYLTSQKVGGVGSRAPGVSTCQAHLQGDEAPTVGENSIIQHLIRSPDHFEILYPMLLEEFDRRGFRLADYQDHFGPLHGDYFRSDKGQEGLASISMDKIAIHKFTKRTRETIREDLKDLLDTLEDEACNRSLRVIRESILENETDSAVYRDVLVPQAIEDSIECLQAGRFEEGRRTLCVLLKHATGSGEKDFPDRPVIARECLEKIDGDLLVGAFFQDGEEREDFDANCQLLVKSGLEEVRNELVDRVIGRARKYRSSTTLDALFDENIEEFVPAIVSYLKERRSFDREALWGILERNLCEACVPILEAILKQETSSGSLRPIALLGKIGGEKAESTLFEYTSKSQLCEDSTLAELCSLQSKAAVPPLLNRLMEKDSWGFKNSSRRKALRMLESLAIPESRKALAKFMTHNEPNFFCRACQRKLVLEAMPSILQWPEGEAETLLRILARDNNSRIAGKAKRLLEQLKNKE